MLLVSSDVSNLTPAAEAIRSLLFPLCWQFPFIPVLPAHQDLRRAGGGSDAATRLGPDAASGRGGLSLDGVLQAPVPCIVGVHRSALSGLLALAWSSIDDTLPCDCSCVVCRKVDVASPLQATSPSMRSTVPLGQDPLSAGTTDDSTDTATRTLSPSLSAQRHTAVRHCPACRARAVQRAQEQQAAEFADVVFVDLDIDAVCGSLQQYAARLMWYAPRYIDRTGALRRDLQHCSPGLQTCPRCLVRYDNT